MILKLILLIDIKMISEFCISENIIGSRDEISPSGRFKLKISNYRTKDGCCNYTGGIITRISDNKIIAEINRNYSVFHHSFFKRNNDEWFWTGKTYMSQCFVNLETGDIYDNSNKIRYESLCWADVKANPSGNILAVEECAWGGSYFISFWNFSDPSRGWSEINIDWNSNENIGLDADDFDWSKHETKWIDENKFEYIKYESFSTKFNKTYFDLSNEEKYDKEMVDRVYYRVLLERKDNKMLVIKLDKSESCKKDKLD